MVEALVSADCVFAAFSTGSFRCTLRPLFVPWSLVLAFSVRFPFRAILFPPAASLEDALPANVSFVFVCPIKKTSVSSGRGQFRRLYWPKPASMAGGVGEAGPCSKRLVQASKPY